MPTAVVTAARQEFVEGFNDVLVAGAGLAFLGAVLPALLVRGSDLLAQEQ